METIEDLQHRYHFAKLALYDMRLRGELQKLDLPAFQDVVRTTAERNGMGEVPSLLNQASFLSFAYVNLVWLWESLKSNKLEHKVLANADETSRTLEISLPESDRISGPRDVSTWNAYFRLLRNAISHGRVEVDDHHFIFTDFDTKREDEPTSLRLTWAEVAKTAELLLHSSTPFIWPNP